jgi:hypothetical protein
VKGSVSCEKKQTARTIGLALAGLLPVGMEGTMITTEKGRDLREKNIEDSPEHRANYFSPGAKIIP